MVKFETNFYLFKSSVSPILMGGCSVFYTQYSYNSAVSIYNNPSPITIHMHELNVLYIFTVMLCMKMVTV